MHKNLPMPMMMRLDERAYNFKVNIDNKKKCNKKSSQ